MVGQVLGHCRIVARIGEGGMGTVYRAHDEVLHRDVAIKVVKKDPALDQAASQDLLQEARASSALSHPNICTIHEVGESDGELYIVMEFIEGETLHDMSAGAGLPSDAVLRYGVQIASALARAHDRGIVHRDLKSANILITPEGLVKVLDFGLAKNVETYARGLHAVVRNSGSHRQYQRYVVLHGAGDFSRSAGRLSQRSVGAGSGVV